MRKTRARAVKREKKRYTVSRIYRGWRDGQNVVLKPGEAYELPDEFVKYLRAFGLQVREVE